MPSVKYGAVKNIMKLIPVKRILSSSPEKLIKSARKINSKKGRGFQIPKDENFIYEDIKIPLEGKDWHCLGIRPRDIRTEKAVLFIFGGGMITEPDMSDIKPAMKISKETDREVWFVFYPLCTDYNAMASIEMVYRSYKKMLEKYSAEDITVLGYSSGACLSISLCHWINTKGENVPMPEKMILISPGAVSDDEDWNRRIEELERKDIMVSSSFIERIGPIMRHGSELPEWVLNPWSRSFSGFPECHFWFGGDEILAASVPNFEDRCREAGIEYTMTVGEGMCHCYPFLPGPSFPEKEEAFREIVKQIKEK